MASGSPSRRRQICATAGAGRLVQDEAGIGVAGTVHEQPHRVHDRRVRPACDVRSAGWAAAPPGTAPLPAIPSGSRLVASTRRPGRPRQQPVGECRAGRGEVLAVVQHQQRSRGDADAGSPGPRRCPGRRAHPPRRPPPDRSRSASVDAGQRRPNQTRPVPVGPPRRRPDGQAGLAHPARPGQSSPAAATPAVHAAPALPVPADERRQPHQRGRPLVPPLDAAGAASEESWRSIACSSARSSGEGSRPSSSSRICRARW